jgi:hypothetical protein
MKEKSISSAREVAGREMLALIREAFAFSDAVSIIYNEIRIPVGIAAFDDDDAREITKDRLLELILPSPEVANTLGSLETLRIEILSKRFKLSLIGVVAERPEGAVQILLPASGVLSNVRKSDRILISEENLTDALIISDHAVHTCLLKFIDITTGALGAYIYTDAPIEPKDHPVLQTEFKGNDLEFCGAARIIRVQRKNSGSSHFEYLVGLEPIISNLSQDSERASRFQLATSLHCIVLSSNTSVQFELTDISASGFRASRCVPALPWMTGGLKIKELSTGLIFTAARMEENGALGVKLSSSSSEDRIKWSNFVLPMVRSGKVSASSHDARALVNVFLEAGGSIADNLAYKRHAVIQSKTQSVLTDRSNVLLRWVNVSPTGTILGHHSSYRIGLNSWFTGDIVGGQTKQRKIDSDFIGTNFKAFKEILVSIKEPQLVFGSWKFGHPYWQAWREFLIAGEHSVFLERYDHISRNQLLPIVDRKIYEQLKSVELLELGSRGIRELLNEFGDSPLMHLLGALDITTSGVFFNGLESIYSSGNMPGFRREIYVLDFNGTRSLAIFSQLPNGVSINGVFDTIFVLPLKSSDSISIDDKKTFLSCIMSLAISKGFRVASVRSLVTPEQPIGVLTELVVLRPEGMEFFCK